MAAEVELEPGRTIVVGTRLHLSPLIDSSNTSLMEASTGSQVSLILTPEPSKPVPGPKPRLTPKPFSVEKNPTIRPILAPKPQPKPCLPNSDPSQNTPSRPDIPSTSKPQQTVRPHSTSISGPSPSRPAAQPFKPEPNRVTPSHVAKRPTAGPVAPLNRGRGQTPQGSAEWSGASRQKLAGPSLTRAKSMGFLTEVGLEVPPGDNKGDVPSMDISAPVPLRPHGRSSRPRPFSAIFSDSPALAASPALLRSGRRPLSTDLTSKFESGGLSLAWPSI
ncbi:proline-rich receptor-like protein kinase PERK9 [Denticeps clupeoides]|uniref:proline-rich receptor-like protein kinase PERK9 n=1 Tax=Denticeps clupeoides TaxID=299321 RepID=UPI0010A2EBF7|nr:proline-rich receptor-like protein kinase PERK9 [Denticeps clupeoides]